MDQIEREQWEARVQEYRKRRRRRKKPSGDALLRHLWDGTDPPLRFDDLIQRWQGALRGFARRVRQGEETVAAWQPLGSYSHWEHLDDHWTRSLEELARAIREH